MCALESGLRSSWFHVFSVSIIGPGGPQYRGAAPSNEADWTRDIDNPAGGIQSPLRKAKTLEQGVIDGIRGHSLCTTH
jgi:hypothetical protein